MPPDEVTPGMTSRPGAASGSSRADEVVIHETEAMDLRGATVIDGFPSVGLVSTIAANYLIDMLKLRPIGIMDAPGFPTLSVVHGGEPLNPVRIYGGEKKNSEGKTERVVVFISEFQPAPPMVRPIADTIIRWAKAKSCGLIISPEGLVLEDDEGNPEGIDVFAIGSTKKARDLIQKKDVKPFTHGIITGVSGILLNLGKRENVDVISILAEAHANYPDARSAATVIEIIAKLIDIKVNVEPLYKEAEGFEKQIRALRKQAAVRDKGQAPSPQMYG